MTRVDGIGVDRSAVPDMAWYAPVGWEKVALAWQQGIEGVLRGSFVTHSDF
jgi:hypothetical protein